MINRRKLLVIAAVGTVSGCMHTPSDGSEPENEAPQYIDDPNLDINFETLGHACIDENADTESINDAEISIDHEEQRITIEGTITDGEESKTAYLDTVIRRVEGPELRFPVETREDTDLDNCPTEVDYRITVEYQMEEYKEYNVYHGGSHIATAEVDDTES